MNNLTLVIPAKNEMQSLPNVLEELKSYDCKKLVVSCQFLVGPPDLQAHKQVHRVAGEGHRAPALLGGAHGVILHDHILVILYGDAP